MLSPHERWAYRCDHTITADDGDPVRNTVTVRGSHGGAWIADSDHHAVDVLHPAIAIDKDPSPASATPGTTIVYTYEVTNIGDAALFDVSVDDDVLGHIGDVGSLAPGNTVTLTHDATLGSAPLTNVGTASGSDVLGRVVSADDSATVTVVSAGDPGGPVPGSGSGGTPFTGAGSGRWIVASLLLLAAGSSALVGTRRRPGSNV